MTVIAATPIMDKMTEEITQLRLEAPLVIGIHTGGAWVAQYIHQALDIPSALGSLDISFYRDDFSRVGLNPEVKILRSARVG